MHILVTGGNGFIGSHLVDALAYSGRHRVVVLDLYPREYEPLPASVLFVPGNLADVRLLRRTLVDHGIEVVYHLAWATIHETATKHPLTDIEQNLVSTVGLLEACREADVRRVIFLSSGGTVYGIPQQFPIREDHPTDPINAYGITKLAAEKYLQMYRHLYGLDYTIFRPSVPYGPRQNPRRRQGAVTVFIYKALRGEPIEIWGDGETLRDYFYIGDMIQALVAALEREEARNAVINLAGAQTYSLNDLVKLIAETLDLQVRVEYARQRKIDVQTLHLDIQAAAQRLGWHPHTPLTEGIRHTAEWIQKWID
jgi:UDP-glucose 4-epimerase